MGDSADSTSYFTVFQGMDDFPYRSLLQDSILIHFIYTMMGGGLAAAEWFSTNRRCKPTSSH